jgi:hypothetical protein
LNTPFKPFELGQIVATRDAVEVVGNNRMLECLQRHTQGQWGEVPPEDARENDYSTHHGLMIRMGRSQPMTFEKHCEKSIRLFEDTFHPSVMNRISTRAKKIKFMTMEPALIMPRYRGIPPFFFRR